jgi:UDP-GlcNAc:undecaprenyl-phosphate/decaprenyl-phosphate GlcNAc-1-phosphate transferase
MTTVLRRVVALEVGSVVAAATFRAGATRPPGGAQRWARRNHRGEPVTLWGGVAVDVGSLAVVAAMPGLPGRVRTAALLAGTTAGVLGGYDDVAGGGDAKGLRGHVGALARGEVTTGGAKLLGIGAAGLVAGALVRPRGDGVTARILAGLLVAGSANLVNLFDLRPGRALKVVLVTAAPTLLRDGVAGDVLAGPVGACAALLPPDLGEQTMLGDAGANCLGALLGVAGAASLSRRWSLAAAVVAVTALTLASERVSFTSLIDSTPLLREADAWGRRPPR